MPSLDSDFAPHAAELDAIQQQIDQSPDVNNLQKKTEAKILPKLFWIGNQLRGAGADEDWVREQMQKPGIASAIKLSTKPWETAHKKLGNLMDLLARQG